MAQPLYRGIERVRARFTLTMARLQPRKIAETARRLSGKPKTQAHDDARKALHREDVPADRVFQQPVNRPKGSLVRWNPAVQPEGFTPIVDQLFHADGCLWGRQPDLEAQPAPLANQPMLLDLLVGRRGLIKDRIAAKARLVAVTLPILRRMLRRRIRQIGEDIATINAELERLADQDPV